MKNNNSTSASASGAHFISCRTKAMALYLIAALMLFSVSCRNEYEPVFDEPANERVEAVVDEYRNRLINASDGWKAFIYPGSEGGYMFFFEFNADGTVTMVSDFNDSTAEQPMDGTFAVKALQRPTLVFDTYSYIHLLSDPDGIVNNGPVGEGLESDFEFAFTHASADSVTLEGIKNNTPITFVPASAAEREGFLAGTIKDSRNTASVYFAANSNPFLTTSGNTVFPVGINDATKILTLFYLDEDLGIQKLNLPFSYSAGGILVQKNISVPGLSFQEMLYDANQENYYVINNDQKLFLQHSSSFISFPQALPPLVQVLGTQYKTIFIDPALSSNNSAAFNSIYDEAAQKVEVEMAAYDLTLGEVILTFESPGSAIISYIVYQNNNDFACNFYYDIAVTQAGRLDFSFTGMNENAELARNSLLPLVNYFENEPLTMEYYADTNVGELLAGVSPQSEEDNYFYGILLEETF